jgi:SAM-dependent methyltransferase
MNITPMPTKNAVKSANKKLYDDIAGDYERIDGRRTPALSAWLADNLRSVRNSAGGGTLLDIGAGSGFVSRCAAGIFDERVGLDLSRKILAANSDAFEMGVCADVDDMPFADGSFDAAVCFAVLHHMYDFEGLVSEVARVLKPGGIFYSDHDLDSAFRRNFALPVHIYRIFKNAGTKKKLAALDVSYDDYDLSEFLSDGVPSLRIAGLLSEAGFDVKMKFHWYGSLPPLDFALGRLRLPRGLAPLLSIRAVKKG